MEDARLLQALTAPQHEAASAEGLKYNNGSH